MYTLTAAFALGFLYGRGAKPKMIPVPPKVIYLPPSRINDIATKTSFPLDEFYKTGLDPQSLDFVLEKAEILYRVFQRRENCIIMLQNAARALNEGRISPSTYRAITRRYTAELIALERDMERVAEDLRRAINQARWKGRVQSGSNELQ